MLVVCTLDFVEAKTFTAMADFVVKFQSIRADPRQHALEILAPVVRAMRSYLYALADEGLEMRQFRQRTIDPGRGDFEQIAPFHRVVNVQQVPDNRAQYLKIAHCDSAAR